MPALDTNVLVRWLVEDDEPKQTERVAALFGLARSRLEPLFVPVSVMLELEWVLRSRFRFGRETVSAVFVALLETQELAFESEAALERALHEFRRGSADFADCLHAGLCGTAGHAPLLSFDRSAARTTAGVALMPA